MAMQHDARATRSGNLEENTGSAVQEASRGWKKKSRPNSAMALVPLPAARQPVSPAGLHVSLPFWFPTSFHLSFLLPPLVHSHLGFIGSISLWSVPFFSFNEKSFTTSLFHSLLTPGRVYSNSCFIVSLLSPTVQATLFRILSFHEYLFIITFFFLAGSNGTFDIVASGGRRR